MPVGMARLLLKEVAGGDVRRSLHNVDVVCVRVCGRVIDVAGAVAAAGAAAGAGAVAAVSAGVEQPVGECNDNNTK